MSQADLPILGDISLHTTLNNLMEAAESRLRTLDEVSKVIYSDPFEFQQILSAAIRTCTEYQSAAEVVYAIQQLLIFYTKYADVQDEWITKRLEKRYLLFLKSKLIKASVKTMQAYDQVSINLFKDVLQKRDLIKTNFALDGSVINKLKQRLKGGKKNGKE